MTTKKAYIARVQLLIPVGSKNEAIDTVSALLSEHAVHEGILLDWSYFKNKDGSFAAPFTAIVSELYREGDFIK